MSQKSSDTASLTTFKEAYEILKHNADSLEQSQVLDIDNLVSVVEQSIDAYKVCQERINAVELALKHAFDETALKN
ncbi:MULTISPECIES: exodeoxyribonuclease VII small subunit [Moraxella]|nr:MULTISPECIES: exodeoxyribonuclease VII small subunit [Moraxella]AWY20447.1 exodeoxyribonuclease VII [Moraxella bovis]OOR89666.1 hypothetical protein B0182_07055 [Moraxella bovis]UYZ67440.1 exodeoxyribonuclease VII small subunit [Moraxella bovis]UYZ69799.1 exodeoxyribonuclease VII small subunit [Moraxella bovis]UYZ74279.1 exodeoxyribonuclease VII small subunit [Moraxella bovis]